MKSMRKAIVGAFLGSAVVASGLTLSSTTSSASTPPPSGFTEGITCTHIGGENKDGGVASADCRNSGKGPNRIVFRANCYVSGYKESSITSVPIPGRTVLAYMYGHCITGVKSWTFRLVEY